jgi:hypothetical protein
MQINKWNFHKHQPVRIRPFLNAAEQPGRIPGINSGHCDILRHDCAGTDSDVIANRDWEDGGVRPDTYMISNLCWPPKIMVPSRRTSVDKNIVDEHCPVRNETIIADTDPLTDERVGLNFASLADRYLLLYLNKRADKRFVSNHAPIEIHRLHDGNVFAKLNIDNADGS